MNIGLKFLSMPCIHYTMRVYHTCADAARFFFRLQSRVVNAKIVSATKMISQKVQAEYWLTMVPSLDSQHDERHVQNHAYWSWGSFPKTWCVSWKDAVRAKRRHDSDTRKPNVRESCMMLNGNTHGIVRHLRSVQKVAHCTGKPEVFVCF